MVEEIPGALSASPFDEAVARAVVLLRRPPVACLSPAPRGGRSRMDLMWHEGRLGVRGPGAAGAWTFEPLGPGAREAAEPGVLVHLEAFVASAPPLGDTQVRVRCAPDGRAGLWLDLSRAGIAALLAEREWLSGRLAAGWTVEVGQRGEAVTLEHGAPALGPITPHAWLPSWTPEGEPLALGCAVASFSQPGPAINRALLLASGRLLDAAGVTTATWCEWGAGYGNLTAWLQRRLGPVGAALESDPRAVAFLRANALTHFPSVTVGQGVAGGSRPVDIPDAEFWIIDPPRPGFAPLLRTLPARPRPPRGLLAWHCHERGLAADTRELAAAGYRLAAWIAVDAFPGTPFLEAVSLWERSVGAPAD